MNPPMEPDYFQSVFDAIPAPAFALDGELAIHMSNRAAREFLAGGLLDVQARRPGDVLRCLNAQKAPAGCGSSEVCPECPVRGAVRAALAGGRVYRREAALALERPWGPQQLDLKLTASPFSHQGRGYVLLILEDVTELKRAAAEKAERQRLQGVLEMAGAAAHEFSQPLQVILGEVEMLLEDTPPGHEHRKPLEALMRASERLAEAVGKVRAITRYRTTPYLEHKRIIDLDPASGGGDGGGDGGDGGGPAAGK